MPIYSVTYHKLAQTGYARTDLELRPGDRVLIALEQGRVLGRVTSGPRESVDREDEAGFVQIERVADEQDLAQEDCNEQFGREAGAFWKECVRNRGLEMKLVDVDVFYDRSKIVFYFTAQSRVDFRELVKDLVHQYRVRIEFRQIGVRHETQMIGAVGNCGMVCCCRRYLREFAPVTIRMAKEQDLFLNPSKVSGICGRLLCCLAYEQESYEQFHSCAPRPGKRYRTDRGVFKVVRTNMFTNSVTCTTESGEEIHLDLVDWQALSPHRVENHPREVQGHHGDGEDAGSPAAFEAGSATIGGEGDPRSQGGTGAGGGSDLSGDAAAPDSSPGAIPGNQRRGRAQTPRGQKGSQGRGGPGRDGQSAAQGRDNRSRDSRPADRPNRDGQAGDSRPDVRSGDGQAACARGRGKSRQTFVTGRVNFRQSGRGPAQETWKRSAGLVRDDEDRPLTPQANPGERIGRYAHTRDFEKEFGNPDPDGEAGQ